jgi:branched-subunit amino acid aminotransferase/4-amino-4-deoxychorismate lyase
VVDFSLLETMRIDRGVIVRREQHLARAAGAAAHFGYPWDATAAERALDDAVAARPDGIWRLRLLVAPSGAATTMCTEHVDDTRVWRVALAPDAVDSRDEFLRHKTTRRDLYNRARATRPDVDEVLLWNERGEITESTIANIVAELAGTWWTPPLSCGLLPGVFRAAVLAADMVRERVITKDDLRRATRLWLINSLREWVKATLVS